MTKPTARIIASDCAEANAAANSPASTKAVTAVRMRPNRSSANIINALEHGKASVMPSVKVLAMVDMAEPTRPEVIGKWWIPGM